MMHVYIEVVGPEGEVVRRTDVTKYSERQRDRIDSGLNINMNHASYFTRTVRKRKPLPEVTAVAAPPDAWPKGKPTAYPYFVQRLKVRVMSPPFDMMRYDHCVPASEEDANKLYRLRPFGKTTPEDHVVEFTRFAARADPPNIERWRSFACEVLDWRWL